MRTETDHFIIVEHDDDCQPRAECSCGRGFYHSCEYKSCYECFLDRRADYVACLYCGRWHSPEFDTCFKCRPQGRDEAARDLKLLILIRDTFQCRYCGCTSGDLQVDPRKVTAADDGLRPAVLHIDHIKPCAKGGTPDPWNLQVLCGVCNVSKGKEWWAGSRHWRSWRNIMAAYLTYLDRFLTGDQRADLERDADEALLAIDKADCLVRAEFVNRVRAARPRPRVLQGVITEDVPADYAGW